MSSVKIKTEKLDEEKLSDSCASGLTTTVSASTFDKTTVNLLISFVAEIYNELANPDYRQKKHIWEQILHNFNEKGYAFSYQQLQKKWSNLLDTYRNNVRKMLRFGRETLKWEFFDSMEKIVGTEQIMTQDACEAFTGTRFSPPPSSLDPPSPSHLSLSEVQVNEFVQTSPSAKYGGPNPSDSVFTILNHDAKSSSSSDEEEEVLRGSKRRLRDETGRVTNKRNRGINQEILKELRTLNSLKKQSLEQRIEMFHEYKEVNRERNKCLAELSASISQIAKRHLQ